MPVNFAPQLPGGRESFGSTVSLFFEPGIYKDAVELLRELAVRTGAIFDDQAEGWNPAGSFAIVLERDQDGNGYIGLRPESPIIVSATKESGV